MESAKECVTTHLPNMTAPKMDDAEAQNAYARPLVCPSLQAQRVGGCGSSTEAEAHAEVELLLVQILVVVANIQIQSLMTEGDNK